MNTINLKAVMLLMWFVISTNTVEQTMREVDESMYKAYEPENLNSYGFVLPVGSKVPEVHQLANDLQYSFFHYQDKSRYEEIAKKLLN